MESHKQLLDKEYESLLQQFSKELEKLQLKHNQDLDRKVSFIGMDQKINIINYTLSSDRCEIFFQFFNKTC